ncbi:MAG: hypothetical protein NTU73_15445, partial [Ignavibacteriae bacterium]|nr:hypothetical protein [Ignavibacteriota bacterium]
VGDITSETFNSLNDEESQKLIWGVLDKNLSKSEIIKITAIFHQTQEEETSRLIIQKTIYTIDSNIWCHKSNDKTKYLMFIDVLKLDNDDYKTIYIIINGTHGFLKSRIYNYPNSVIDWMQIESDEIYLDLLKDTYESGRSEIEIDLMNKYEAQEKLGYRGDANKYHYLFNNFILEPIKENQFFLNEKEILLLKKIFDDIPQFSIKKIIINLIDNSNIRNN